MVDYIPHAVYENWAVGVARPVEIWYHSYQYTDQPGSHLKIQNMNILKDRNSSKTIMLGLCFSTVNLYLSETNVF